MDHEKKKPLSQAAQIYRLHPASLHCRINILQHPSSSTRHHPCEKSDAEERTIFQVDLRGADMGKPFRRVHLIEDIFEYCHALTLPSQRKLPFVDFAPGDDSIRNFIKRKDEHLRLGFPAEESEQRWRECNAEMFTNHLDIYETYIKMNEMDETPVYNLDEMSVASNKDKLGRSSSKRLVRSGKAKTLKIREETFNYTHRITMLVAVCTDGTRFPPIFVISGEEVPYRLIDDGNNDWKLEHIHDLLPEGAQYTKGKDTAKIDRNNFSNCAISFIESVQHKISGDRKVLLTYDGHRSQLSARALEILRKSNVLAYFLPAQTSGKTQPMDVEFTNRSRTT